MVVKDKAAGCVHHWHGKQMICSETETPIENLSHQKCCICNVEQFIDDRIYT